MKLLARVVVACCLACGAASSAHADDTPSASAPATSPGPKEHYDKGMIFYSVQDWPEAIRELKAAYEGDPRAEYLYALAQAQRLSGDCPSAILTYRAFLRGASGSPAAAAEGLIHLCEAQVKQQQDAAAPKAAPPETAVPGPAPAPAPSPAPPPLPERASPARWYADPLGDTLAGVGVAGLVMGTAFLIRYGSNVSDAKTAPSDRASQSDWSSAKPQVIVGATAGSVGVVALAAAIWRYAAVNAHGREHSETPPVGLSVAPGAFQLSYGSQF